MMRLEQYNEMVDNLSSALNDEKFILEYKLGGSRMGSKYLQRFGVPGKYKYVYPTKKLARLSRKARFFYARFLKRSKSFFNKLSSGYDAQSFNVKPKTWSTAIVSIRKKDGNFIQMHVDLKKHGIYSYKSKRGQGGAALALGRAKKKGILRYR